MRRSAVTLALLALVLVAAAQDYEPSPDYEPVDVEPGPEEQFCGMLCVCYMAISDARSDGDLSPFLCYVPSLGGCLIAGAAARSTERPARPA